MGGVTSRCNGGGRRRWMGWKSRFKEAELVEQQGLEGCELGCHGVLKGLVRIGQVVKGFLEGSLLVF